MNATHGGHDIHTPHKWQDKGREKNTTNERQYDKICAVLSFLQHYFSVKVIAMKHVIFSHPARSVPLDEKSGALTIQPY